ncbi:MAG: M23 family metallopeptidase [Sphingobacterium sp.]|uniref:M23 family metallopeptidase n=1 Tax=Sphingobacterium sp. JB170 TaxID=1434842 RepID=UPI00097ED49C|nr:M23 family metallopeptidase [Sphingobacterium sp. JB170]SJN50008.1 Peptidase, M23/M37 family [Sphingobacterium sp. JB170]
MLKKKTSVLFVEPDGTSTKKIQVPTVVVTHWKKVMISSIILISAIVLTAIFAVRQYTSERYTTVYGRQINDLKAQNRQLEKDEFDSQTTAEEMKKSFNSIDSTLERINQKMKKRGLKAIKMENVGGPIEEESDDYLIELSQFYKEQLIKLENRLEGMPLGTPHPGRITSPFGYRRNPFTNRGREMHSGVDLKGKTGDPVKSTAKGEVTFAGYQGNYGYVVMMKHSNGYETRYAHLVRTRVKKGEYVEAGEIVGLLGSTGRSTGPHLHYEVLVNSRKVNPAKYFNF